MIYMIEKDIYPKDESKVAEELSYLDENDFEWRIARVDNGLMIKYCGNEYFKSEVFYCEVEDKIIKVNNTNCIFIQDTSFDTFYIVREVIMEGFTDDIWGTFKEMLEERLMCDEGLLESEKT